MSNIIVMAFSPRNIVGCFLKKTYKGGGVRGTPGLPLATPLSYINWIHASRTENKIIGITRT